MKHIAIVITAAAWLAASVHVSAQAPAPAADGAWKTSAALGASVNDGNSDAMTLNGNVTSGRKTAEDELRLYVDGNYGESDGETNTENAKGGAGYRHILSGMLYGYLDTWLAYDKIADVDYRFVFSPGLGYYPMRDDRATLGVEAGPAYIREKVGGEEDDIFALRLAQRYDRKLSETAKCWQMVEYMPEFEDFENYLLNFEIGVEAAVAGPTSIRLVLKDSYDSTPAADREENDLSIVAGIAVQL